MHSESSAAAPAADTRAVSRADDEPLVAIRSLTKYYTRGEQVIPVLVDINIDVMAGDYIALMGPSGSGKSTLLNLIAGIDKPTSGEIHVAGVDIARLSEGDLAAWRAANVGFIFQFYNLMPVLTAFQNVELPLQLTSLSRRERRERVETALALVGLSDRATHYPQRAVRRPAATRGHRPGADHRSDADRRRRADRRPRPDDGGGGTGPARALNAELGKTIIMVTHDPKAASHARKIVQLEKGVLVG